MVCSFFLCFLVLTLVQQVVMPIPTPVLPTAALPHWCGVRGLPPIVLLIRLLLFLRLALGPPHWTVSSSIVLAPLGPLELLIGPGLVEVLRMLAVGIYTENIINPQSHALSILVRTQPNIYWIHPRHALRVQADRDALVGYRVAHSAPPQVQFWRLFEFRPITTRPASFGNSWRRGRFCRLAVVIVAPPRGLLHHWFLKKVRSCCAAGMGGVVRLLKEVRRW